MQETKSVLVNKTERKKKFKFTSLTISLETDVLKWLLIMNLLSV